MTGHTEGSASPAEALFDYLQDVFDAPVRDQAGNVVPMPFTQIGGALWQTRWRTFSEVGRRALPETSVLSEERLELVLNRNHDGDVVRVGFYLPGDTLPFNLYSYRRTGGIMLVGTNAGHRLPQSHFGSVERLIRATLPQYLGAPAIHPEKA